MHRKKSSHSAACRPNWLRLLKCIYQTIFFLNAIEPVDRVEVVDRYTVKFLLKEPFVWLVNMLANPLSMWIIAPEVVEKYGDLKKAEHAIGTGPFLLERYEPNVKTVFKRNPDDLLPGQPCVAGVEWSSGDAAWGAGVVYGP